jgi:hypothetical protein
MGLVRHERRLAHDGVVSGHVGNLDPQHEPHRVEEADQGG